MVGRGACSRAPQGGLQGVGGLRSGKEMTRAQLGYQRRSGVQTGAGEGDAQNAELGQS